MNFVKCFQKSVKFSGFILPMFLFIEAFTFYSCNSASDEHAKQGDIQGALKNFSSLAVTGAQAKADDFPLVPESFSHLAEMISPAVVNISTVKTVNTQNRMFRHFEEEPFDRDDPMRDFFKKFFGPERQRDFKQQSLGSGFIIDAEGYIVTNNHVIENADEIKVILKDEAEFDAEIVGRDANTDIALIKIKTEINLPEVKFGDSEVLEVGQWVMAIGNPFGLEHTVTAGIVSAKGRVIGSGPYDDFIQTDASINPGNSGGPLINMNGEVVGINTIIIAGGQGIGFAIPINLAKGIIDQLKDQGEVTRGWLGVSIQDIKGELADYYGVNEGAGVLVVGVVPGDPADEAGIQPHDIILEINGKSVESSRSLIKRVADIDVGETINIEILREGKRKTFYVKVAKREETKVASVFTQKKGEDALGIRVSNMTPKIARQFDLTDSGGAVVVSIAPDSKADKSGVQVGDIIKGINRKEIKTAAQYHKVIGQIKKGDAIALLMIRKNRGFVVAKLTK
jgi:serine protease Do